MLPNFAGMMRSLLPASPVAKALDQSHRQARRWLDTGGAVSTTGRGSNRQEPKGFVVPRDIDRIALTAAINAKLRGQIARPRSTAAAVEVIQRTDGGRLVVTAEIVRRLGGGDEERGRRFLDPAIRDQGIRARRNRTVCSGAL